MDMWRPGRTALEPDLGSKTPANAALIAVARLLARQAAREASAMGAEAARGTRPTDNQKAGSE
jgi:hypothetical protein